MLLDTHVLVWLHVGTLDRFSDDGRALLESEPLRIAPASLLELGYLREVGRVTSGPEVVLAHLTMALGVQVDEIGAARLVGAALDLSWTRDPFDRLIAAQAVASGQRLMTADKAILEHLSLAVPP